MTAYATSNQKTLAVNPVLPALLFPGDEAYLFGTAALVPGSPQKPTDATVQFEAVALNERSLAVCFAPRPGGGSPAGCEVQVFANANPGAAEIDVQISNVDADGAYMLPATPATFKITVWTQVGGSNVWVGSAPLQPLGADFMSLVVIANPNGVSYWAKVKYV